jgi:hypothetical protein
MRVSSGRRRRAADSTNRVLSPASSVPDAIAEQATVLGAMKLVFENVRRMVGMVPLSFMRYADPRLIADIFERVGSAISGAVSETFRRVDLRLVFACIMGDDLAHGRYEGRYARA